jgi:sugar transferase (PEP-CTERM system associated)
MVRLFRVFIPVGVLILLITEVLLIAGLYVAAAYLGYQGDPVEYLVYSSGRINIALVTINIVLGLYLQDLYTDVYVKSHLELIQQLCFVVGATFLVQGVISYLDHSLRMPLHVMLPGSAMTLVGLFGWRVLFGRYAFERMGGDRLLLVGGSPALAEVAAHIELHPEKGIKVIGALNDDAEGESSTENVKFLGRIDALREVVSATQPTRIVIGMQERRNRMPVSVLLDLRYSGHLIEEAPTTYERVCGRVCTKELRPSQLIYSGEFGPRRRILVYQNIANTALAAIAVVISAPLMLLTALAVRFSSAGPILYRQTRVGMDGVSFTLYKFRSMRTDAEVGTGAVWAQKNDPRVTPVGRLIRRIRFDELPQFFNVLKGDMSIVGPRPERPEFVKVLAEKIPYYRQRHAVRPGITGWAQINYKYGDTFEDTIAKLEYDLYYIKNMSMALDNYIIFHTLKAMLLSRGAQ